jgi:hypothetical protein
VVAGLPDGIVWVYLGTGMFNVGICR